MWVAGVPFCAQTARSATRAHAQPLAAAERHGHSGSRAAWDLRLCQLPCGPALARARKARLICSGLNYLMEVQLGFMGIQLGGEVIWAGSRGLRPRCGNFRAAAGGCHHACQMMQRRGADAAVRPLACSSIPADRDHCFRRSGARTGHAAGRRLLFAAECRPGGPCRVSLGW